MCGRFTLRKTPRIKLNNADHSEEPKGIINARVETIEEKPSFKESFERRRCLILADLWLSENSRAADLKDLLVPFPADQMRSHAVSYEVNDVKIDDARLLRQVEPNIGVTPRLF